jgi:hypothetical protein
MSATSTDRPTHGWCPTCKEDSAIDAAGNCLWCGGPTQQRQQRNRGGWKRPDLAGSRYTEPQLRALHLAHMRGESLNSLAKQTHQVVGYKTYGSAAAAISRDWKRMGLCARDRVEASVKASTKHGLAPKHGSRPGYGTYKRRVLRGEADRPRCKGIRTQPPRKGEPCESPAMQGSEYCFGHDPERRAEVEQILVDARLRQSDRDMIPMAPFAAWLRRRQRELGTWRAVAESVGRDVTLVNCYGRGRTTNRQPKGEISRSTVEALLAADGTATFGELYGAADADVEAVAA